MAAITNVTIAHAKSVTIPDYVGVVTVNNSSGGTTTVNATDLARPSDWNSVHNATLQLYASDVIQFCDVGPGLTESTSSNGLTWGIGTEGIYEPFPLHNTNSTVSAPGIGTWYLDGPYCIRKPYPAGQFCLLVTNAAGFQHGAVFTTSTGAVSKTAMQTINEHLALYRQGTGAQSTQLSLYQSKDISFLATWAMSQTNSTTSEISISNWLTLSFPSQWDSSGGCTYGSISQSGTTSTAVSTAASTLANNLITSAIAYLSGSRMDIIPWASSIPPDNYWLGHMFSSTSSTSGALAVGTMFSTHYRAGLLEYLANGYKKLGQSVSNSISNVQPYHGYLATTTSLASSVIAPTDIRATSGRAYFMYMQSTF